MYARVNTFLGSPGRFDDDLADVRDNTIPALEEVAGYNGLIILNDRASGRSVAITFWESEDDLRASEEEAARVRHDNAAGTDNTVLSVERYEVALDSTR